jgi:Protein of unknown function (DUF3768)
MLGTDFARRNAGAMRAIARAVSEVERRTAVFSEPGGSANAGSPPPGEGVRTVGKLVRDSRTISGRTTKTKTIRALNDELRQNLTVGTAFITAGVAALGPEAVARIVKTIAVYDDFCHANDPHEEHDFGSFEVDGQTIFFKIDYFDKALASHSPDPSDPSVTERVITIMLAEEY